MDATTLPLSMSNYGEIWYRNSDEIPVAAVEYTDGTQQKVNAITEPPELKQMQDAANAMLQKEQYKTSALSLHQVLEDTSDVMMNLVPELLYSQEKGVLKKGNRLRGIAIILIGLALIGILLDILLSDA
jgi:hypothetical protein